MKVDRQEAFQIFCIIILFFFAGCSVPPSESTVEGVIIKHFEAKQYTVLEIELGDIQRTPLSERRYMGVEAYLVDVPSLTLEAGKDIGEPWNYKKGQRLTFSNASIKIKKSDGQTLGWIIESFSGISAP